MTIIEEFSQTASNPNIPDTHVEEIFNNVMHHASKEIREHVLNLLRKYRPSIIRSWNMWPNSPY